MWQMMSIEETKRKLRTNLDNGLTDEEVKNRQVKYGLNKLEEKKVKEYLLNL